MLIQKRTNRIIYGFCVVLMVLAGTFVGKNLSEREASHSTLQSVVTPIEDIDTLISANSTIMTAEYVGQSEPYGIGPGSVTLNTGEEIDLNEYYVDIEVQVKNVLKGDVSTDDTIVIQEHIGATPDCEVPSMADSQEYLFFLNSEKEGEPLHMIDSNVCQYIVSKNGELLSSRLSKGNSVSNVSLAGMTVDEVANSFI